MNKCVNVLMSIGIVYLLGVGLFSSHMGFRTYVNGKSVFMQSKEEVLLDLQKDVNHQMLQLVRRDGTSEYVTYEQLGVVLKEPVSVDMFRSNPWLWFLDIFKRTDYTVDTAVLATESDVRQCVSQLECMSAAYVVSPMDSFVRLLADGSYDAVPHFGGNVIDEDALVVTLMDAVESGQLVLDLEASCVYQYDTVIHNEMDMVSEKQIDVLQSCELSLDLGASMEVIVPEVIIESAVYEKDGQTYVHYPVMYAYVTHLSEQFDTKNTERQFVTSDGVTLSLQPSDVDTFVGWDLDEQQTAEVLCDALVLGENAKVKALWLSRGKSHGGLNDFGSTYIELSIEKQHMWCYVDGVLLFDTDVTTGTDSIPSQRTPTGMFLTMDWNTEYTMHGSYGTAFSHYFIRLTPWGVGIHDSSWRTVYGGTEYLNNGSHGCINTPYDKVKLLYDTLYEQRGIGIPTIIY